ncbi:hypothetical protein ONZ51_g1677 [Trametes cubensis]|uniref:DUF6534 domain-containing protein n=1 Tax=Trametes cubensis TaxID=1111947 RepID=A0AAD7U262_9APHY|nr:hypothetical protein ONZ51_g1677 [Trametes cubensis]
MNLAMEDPRVDLDFGLPQLPSLNDTLGAVLLGAIFGFIYYRMYPNDGVMLKGLILIIVAMETFHTAMWILVCYEYLVVSYFNPLNLITIHWYIRLTIPLTAFTGIFSQIFYAGRVYYIGPQYRLLVAIAVVVMFVSLGWDLVATAKVFRSKTLLEFEQYSWIVSVAYGLAVLCDIITASALIFVLRRSRTGVRRTDSVVDVLVLYTINTGLLTTVVGMLVFIFALVRPGNLIYAAISIPGVKLYSNSVLAMLNSRRSLSARMNHDFGGDSEAGRASRPTTPRPRTVLETWNVRQVPISLPVTIDITASTHSDVEAMAGYSPDCGSTDGETSKGNGESH